MRQVGVYRIRWALVTNLNGRRSQKVRMCIAERKFRFIGWWPIADWRHKESHCQDDINYDRDLRKPLPETRYGV